MRKINFKRTLASLVIGASISLTAHKSNADTVSIYDNSINSYNIASDKETQNTREAIWKQALISSLYENKETNTQNINETPKIEYKLENRGMSVPEPATIALMTLGAAAALRKRKKYQ